LEDAARNGSPTKAAARRGDPQTTNPALLSDVVWGMRLEMLLGWAGEVDGVMVARVCSAPMHPLEFHNLLI
jgi:hypothetical protein